MRGRLIAVAIAVLLALPELPQTPEKMEPELIISGNPIDYELTELLGEKSADFIVLCFDGVQFERFGTPYDTPRQRESTESMIRLLNSRDKKETLWPEMWKNWAGEIRKQYGLPADATADDFRPVVSYQIKRVCYGRSENLHCAIRLFEELADKIKTWGVRKCDDGKHLVEIVTADGRPMMDSGEKLPMTICKVVRRMLKSSQAND